AACWSARCSGCQSPRGSIPGWCCSNGCQWYSCGFVANHSPLTSATTSICTSNNTSRCSCGLGNGFQSKRILSFNGELFWLYGCPVSFI
ncbi:hypothetical protein T265_03348, partial [Opisthorchis viverrini]